MEKETEKLLRFAMDKCTGCLDCAAGCDHLLSQGSHPGGIAEGLLSGQGEDIHNEFILKCSLCGLCREQCANGVDIPGMVSQMRREYMKSGINDPETYRFFWVDHDWNAFTLFLDTYGLKTAYKDLLKDQCEVLFFPGCMLVNEGPELVRDTVKWLSRQGNDVGVMLHCCGMPLQEIGLIDRADEFAGAIWRRIREMGAKRVVTSCPSCHARFLETREDHRIEIVSLYQLMAESGLKAPVTGEGKITVHDSCTDRRGKIGQWVRKILKDYEIVEMAHHGAQTICCGSGGIVSTVDPEICEQRADQRLQEACHTGTNVCITYCMSCARRLTARSGLYEILHILELVLGHRVDHERYNEQVRAMWEDELGDKNTSRLEGSKLMAV